MLLMMIKARGGQETADGLVLSLQCVVALYALCTTAKELQVESACCSMIAATLDHTHTHSTAGAHCPLDLAMHAGRAVATQQQQQHHQQSTHTTVLHALPPLCSLVINSTASNVKATRGNTHRQTERHSQSPLCLVCLLIVCWQAKPDFWLPSIL